MKKAIRVEVIREDDGRYLATTPQFPGVKVHGDTEEEAVGMARATALAVLAGMIANGEKIPEGIESSSPRLGRPRY